MDREQPVGGSVWRSVWERAAGQQRQEKLLSWGAQVPLGCEAVNLGQGATAQTRTVGTETNATMWERCVFTSWCRPACLCGFCCKGLSCLMPVWPLASAHSYTPKTPHGLSIFPPLRTDLCLREQKTKEQLGLSSQQLGQWAGFRRDLPWCRPVGEFRRTHGLSTTRNTRARAGLWLCSDTGLKELKFK